MLLFDGDNLSVVAADADSETAIVTFTTFEGDVAPWASDFVSRERKAGAYFVAKQKHWWQTPEMIPATRAARAFLSNYSRKVGYGSSMGAYGALLWSNEISLTSAFVAAPQSTIASGAMLNPKWSCPTRIYRDDMAETMVIRPQVVFDPFDAIDSWQMQQLSNFEPLLAPFGGHKALGVLRDGRRLKPVVSDAFNGTLTQKAFRDAYRASRANSATYWRSLMRLRQQSARRLLAL